MFAKKTLIEAIDDIQETKMSTNFYADASNNDLLRIIDRQMRTIIDARVMLDDIKEYAILLEKKQAKLDEAEIIIHHWKVFNKHLEKNPSLKEEWDALCMAIKLTEDD